MLVLTDAKIELSLKMRIENGEQDASQAIGELYFYRCFGVIFAYIEVYR